MVLTHGFYLDFSLAPVVDGVLYEFIQQVFIWLAKHSWVGVAARPEHDWRHKHPVLIAEI